MNGSMRLWRGILLLVVLIISGCGGGGSGAALNDVATVTLSANRTSAVASISDHVTFTATVTDVNGAPLAGQEINFTVPNGVYPYTSSGRTDAHGTATIKISHRPVGSTHPATVTVTATSGAVVSNEVTVTFSNAQQTPALVTLTVDKVMLVSDGVDKVVFTITATDSSGAPLPGQEYIFNSGSSSDGPSLLGVGTAFTGEDGQADFTVKCRPTPAIFSPVVIPVTVTINGVTSNAVNVTAKEATTTGTYQSQVASYILTAPSNALHSNAVPIVYSATNITNSTIKFYPLRVRIQLNYEEIYVSPPNSNYVTMAPGETRTFTTSWNGKDNNGNYVAVGNYQLVGSFSSTSGKHGEMVDVPVYIVIQ